MPNGNQLFTDFSETLDLVEQSIPLIGNLYRKAGVVTLMYGRPLMHRTPMEIIQEHRYVSSVEERHVGPEHTVPLLKQMASLKLTPARIDIGKLTVRWLDAQSEKGATDLNAFLDDELSLCVGGAPQIRSEPQDVVLYGFGRIGRLVARLLMERAGNGEGLRLRAAVVRRGKGDDLQKRASLLRRDSVHGFFKGAIDIDREADAIIANGHKIKLIYAPSPADVDYTAHGIKDALICDNTGVWRSDDELGIHLKCPGAGKVLLTAPGKGAVANIVCGVNDDVMGADDTIVSAASCTTNAIVPVLKAMNDKYGIASGHIESVHAYTNDQNLIDNYHKKERRGRSAPLNMVLTETGAAKAVAKAIPELKGKLTGNAVRVPTPNVSLAIINLNLDTAVERDELNAHLKWSANHSALHKQIDYVTSPEIVSSDLVGSRHAGIVDSQSTIADGKRCVLYVWYDNEFGYSVQVVRILQRMAGIHYPFFPAA